MSQSPDNNFIDFISEHHVLTLATCVDSQPWCASCFYTYWEDENIFIFTSDKETRHASEALNNNKIAGSIVLETKTVGKIQGLQIEGTLDLADGDIKTKAKKKYLKTFPFAVLKQTDLWLLKPTFLKLTDNRLGFGKKLYWPSDHNK